MAVFSRNVFVMAILFFSLLSFTEARDHLVGGKTNSWKIPSSESDSLNRWAEKTRFLVGDSLGTLKKSLSFINFAFMTHKLKHRDTNHGWTAGPIFRILNL